MAWDKGKLATKQKQRRQQNGSAESVQTPRDKNAGRSLRNQIRGVDRLLKRGLDEPARAVQESKLASLQAQLEAQQAQQRHSTLERKMTLRYRKVRLALLMRCLCHRFVPSRGWSTACGIQVLPVI